MNFDFTDEQKLFAESVRRFAQANLAKDAITRADHFRAMEPRLAAWTKVRDKWDPQHSLRSAQSVRLLGDGR